MFCTAALLLASQIAGGNFTELFSHSDGSYFERYGSCLAAAGDVNADGHPDLIVGAFNAYPPGAYEGGEVRIYSGANGVQLHYFAGSGAADHFGISADSAGDVNADGYDDILIGSPNEDSSGYLNNGAVYLYSGKDGSVLKRWEGVGSAVRLGGAVANLGDVDGDGSTDVAFRYGIPVGVDRGRVVIRNLTTDVEIHHLGDPAGVRSFGTTITAAGDLNQDGHADILIGAPDEAFGFNSEVGTVSAYSGADGSLLHFWKGNGGYCHFGETIAKVLDQNGDGTDDIMIGGSGANFGTGMVFFFSGANGDMFRKLHGDTGDSAFGSSVASLGDVNGDGFGDYIIGAEREPTNGQTMAGAVYLFLGPDARMVKKWKGDVAGANLGASVCGPGDLNLDGFPDMAMAADRNFAASQSDGQVIANSFNPYITASASAISASAGGTVQLDYFFPAEAGGMEYKTMFSFTGIGPMLFGVEVPLSFDESVWQTYLGNYPFANHSDLHGTLNANGEGTSQFRVPAGLPGALLGQTVYLAAVANPIHHLPHYSSAPVPIQIVP
jgi:hypothetical protein